MHTPAIVIDLASRIKATLRTKRSTRPPLRLQSVQSTIVMQKACINTTPEIEKITVQTVPHKPLRIVHVSEGVGQGRMRISGRMDDVCAELDRLAALEAA